MQDLVTGLFILLEKQYAVGDFVEIGGVSGFVEDVGIRVTRIRDVNGALRMIAKERRSSTSSRPTRDSLRASRSSSRMSAGGSTRNWTWCCFRRASRSR